MDAIWSLIFWTSSLLPRPSWYGICASSLSTFFWSFLLNGIGMQMSQSRIQTKSEHEHGSQCKNDSLIKYKQQRRLISAVPTPSIHLLVEGDFFFFLLLRHGCCVSRYQVQDSVSRGWRIVLCGKRSLHSKEHFGVKPASRIAQGYLSNSWRVDTWNVDWSFLLTGIDWYDWLCEFIGTSRCHVFRQI